MLNNDMDDAQPGQVTPSPVSYTAEEVARHFGALLDGLDFRRDIRELGIGALSVFKRKKAVRELTALSVSLWKLTLERSFPQDAEAFFAHFLDTSPRCAEGKKGEELRALITAYMDLLAEKRDNDFSAVAQHIVDALALGVTGDRAFFLKISLRVRHLYNFIFDRLI